MTNDPFDKIDPSGYKRNAGWRSLDVDYDTVKQMIKTKFNDAVSLSGKGKFYRGVDSDYGDVHIIDPSKLARQSKDSKNLYYILMDHLPSWEGYPSRSKSIIFTNKKSEAEDYGSNTYEIYPVNDANIGWANYKTGFIGIPYVGKRLYNTDDCSTFSQTMSVLISRLGTYLNNKNIDDDLFVEGKWQIVFEELKKIDLKEALNSKDFIDNYIGVTMPGITSSRVKTVIKDFNQSGFDNMWDYLNELFDPVKNKIKKGSVKDAIRDIGEPTKEYWTSDYCLLRKIERD